MLIRMLTRMLTRRTTHGELPGPACGYQRRGLAHENACPECGARGLSGDLVVSGMPTETPEAKLAERVHSLSHLVPAVLILIFAIAWGVSPFGLDRMFTRVRALLMLAAIAIMVYAWIRRRRRNTTGLSLERCVWEFEPDAVVVREYAKETRIPLHDITEVSAQIDFVKRRTRVTLVTSGASLGSAGLPELFLHGSLNEQRECVTAMKERAPSA